VIIVDTNILHGASLDGPQIQILRRLATQKGLSLRIPEMVGVEFIYRQNEKFEALVSKARNAVEALDKESSLWGFGRDLEFPTPDTLTLREVSLLKSIFEVIPTTPEDAWEALKREALRVPPARQNGTTACGARDALIWLTVLRCARDQSGPVYLISNDQKAFGEDGLKSMLEEEARESGSVIYCSSIKDLLATLGTEVAFEAFDEALLEADSTKFAVRAYLQDTYAEFDVLKYAPSFKSWMTRGGNFATDGTMNLQLVRTRGRHAYESTEGLWFAISTDWQAEHGVTYGFMDQADPKTGHLPQNVVRVSFEVTVDLIFSSLDGQWKTEGTSRSKLRNIVELDEG
jgi:hypothetical protein